MYEINIVTIHIIALDLRKKKFQLEVTWYELLEGFEKPNNGVKIQKRNT